MLLKERFNFNNLEGNTFKEISKLARKIIQDELRMSYQLIKEYRDKEIFEVKDMPPTMLKTKLGEISITRRRYKTILNGKAKYIYLLD